MGWGGSALLALLLAAAPLPLAAQQRDTFPGVTLGMVYESSYHPALGVQPFTGRFGGSAAAASVEAIIDRDLRYSDRFQMLDSLPPDLVGGSTDYSLWDKLGATWLVTGQVEGADNGYVARIELHDVVYRRVRDRGQFQLPEPDSAGFRMAVHRISDQIVRWATGDPGMAASRIAFSMASSDSTDDLYLIDSDGENLRQLTHLGTIAMSPAWSPDGAKIAFTTLHPGDRGIYQMDLATGRIEKFNPLPGGQYVTPAYAPDGRTLAFGVLGTGADGLYTYNVARRCCLKRLTHGPWKDLSPTYSPDGSQIAFNTDRFGTTIPQIMVMPADGGEAETVSPLAYGTGGGYTEPQWSPRGDLLAFQGQISGGNFQILVADMKTKGRRLRQLTWQGNNADPTWAPDGRHIAFTGQRNGVSGLFVVDVATGKTRLVLAGSTISVPDWSPALGSP